MASTLKLFRHRTVGLPISLGLTRSGPSYWHLSLREAKDYGRGVAVGRGLGVGACRGVGVGLGVGLPVAVDVGVAVAVTVGVAVVIAVGVAVGLGLGVPPWHNPVIVKV